MPFRYRLIIIILAILIFVISAPLIILYGQGYRYDFQNRRLTKTGSLIIESTPANASVILDGRIQRPKWYQQLLFYKKLFGLTTVQSNTPTAVSNLLPGQHRIEVQKDGYYPWQKRLDIQAERTTNAGKIQLLLKNPSQELIIKDDVDFAYPLNDGKKIIYAVYNPRSQESEIKSFSLDKPSEINSLAKISGRIVDAEESQNYILFTAAGLKFFIVDLSASQIISLNNRIKAPTKVMFYDNLFYVQSANIIYSFDPKTEKLNPAFNLSYYYQGDAAKQKKSSLIDWLIKNNNLYLLIKNPEDVSLDKHHFESAPEKYSSKSTLLNLTLPIYQFKFTPTQINNNLIFLKTDRDIFIVNGEQETNPIIFKNRAINITARPDIQKILYYNDFEIFLAETTKDSEGKTQIKDELINRGSQPINRVVWYPNGAYFIASGKNNVWAVEVDGRDVRNIYKLLEVDEVKNIWFMGDQRDLYLLGKISAEGGSASGENNQSGIWQIRLQ